MVASGKINLKPLISKTFQLEVRLFYVVQGRESEVSGWVVVFPHRLLPKGVVRERFDVFKHADFVVGCF